MTMGTDLGDLGRRLVELADSAGPWDDPLPEIRRRAADMTSSSDSVTDERAVFRTPTATRRPRGWLGSINLTLLASAAVVVAMVAGVGWLLHAGGPSSVKSSSAGPAAATSAAASASSAGSAQGERRPAPKSATALCGWPAPTSAVTLRAPARVRSGAKVSLGVRLTGPAAADVYAPLVVVVSNGQVVGHLWAQVTPPGPRVRPSTPTAATITVTGTLRRSSCAQATAPWRGLPSPRGLALAPGRYQLIAVSRAAGQPVVSAPVTVTVIR